MNDFFRYLKYKNKYMTIRNKQKISEQKISEQKVNEQKVNEQKVNEQKVNEQKAGSIIFTLTDEVHFWSRQMMEHMFILCTALEGDETREESKREGNRSNAFIKMRTWISFINEKFGILGSTEYNMENGLRIVDYKGDRKIEVTKDNIDNILLHINDTINFKKNLLDQVKKGWIGWVFPSLLEHMLKEAIYFKNKIYTIAKNIYDREELNQKFPDSKEYSIVEEINFINVHHTEELAATAQFIDPSEQTIIDTVRAYALKYMTKLNDGKSLSGAPKIETALTVGEEDILRQWSESDEEKIRSLNLSEQQNVLAISIVYGDEIIKLANKTIDEIGEAPKKFEEVGEQKEQEIHKIEGPKVKSCINRYIAAHAYREFVRFNETLNKLKENMEKTTIKE